MRKISIIFALMFFALSTTSVMAQEESDSTVTTEVKEKKPAKEKSKQNFTFIYAVHDGKDATSKLITMIKDAYDRAVRQGDRCIIYVPNQRNPLVVQVNAATDTIDSDVALNNLFGELNNRLSFNMNVKFDNKKIIDLFTENEFLDDDGELAYRSVAFNMYITSRFWERGYNEKMIPALYFALDIHRLYYMQYKEIVMSVYYSGTDEDIVEADILYGIRNYNNINADDMLDPMAF